MKKTKFSIIFLAFVLFALAVIPSIGRNSNNFREATRHLEIVDWDENDKPIIDCSKPGNTCTVERVFTF